NYLALARAAHEQMAFDRRDSYIRKAHASAPDADIVIGLTQAELQINQGQWEQALAVLKHLKTLAPKHVLVFKLLERVYIHLGDWQSLLALIPSLYKAGIITREHVAMLEAKAYVELIKKLNHHEIGLTGLKEFWVKVPRKFQKDPEVI